MLERIGVVFQKEVTDNLRDRRTLLASMVYPLFGPLMIAVLLSLVGQTLSSSVTRPLQLPVNGAQYAPALVDFLRQSNVEVGPPVSDPEGAVSRGEADVVLVIQPDYEAALRAGQPAPVRLVVDASRQAAAPATTRARRLLEQYNGQIAALRLLARGVSPSVVAVLAIEERDVATPQSQAANLLSIAPYFIIFSIFIGGMYLAIDATTGERERGSLEPLLINPVRRSELVLGKLLATLLFTVLAVAETVVAFGVVLNLVRFDVPVGLGPSVLLAIFLISLPITLLAAALQMIVATFTQSFKEAQNYLSFMMLVPALPGMFLAFVPVRPALWMMAVPTFGQQVLINQTMRGSPVEPLHVAVATLTTLVAGLIFVLLAIRMYQQESVLFRA